MKQVIFYAPINMIYSISTVLYDSRFLLFMLPFYSSFQILCKVSMTHKLPSKLFFSKYDIFFITGWFTTPTAALILSFSVPLPRRWCMRPLLATSRTWSLKRRTVMMEDQDKSYGQALRLVATCRVGFGSVVKYDTMLRWGKNMSPRLSASRKVRGVYAAYLFQL